GVHKLSTFAGSISPYVEAMKLPLYSLLGLLALPACDGGGPTFFKDVRPLVEAKCQGCHVPGAIAPFSLVSYQDLSAHARFVRAAVSTRKMPPWPAAPGCTSYQADRSLSDAEIERIMGWIDAGMAQGNPDDYVAPPLVRSGLSRVDQTLAMPAPYLPRFSPDD